MPPRDSAQRRMVLILLVVTAATGAIDAVSILHFHAFTAFVTGTMVLLGAELVGQAHAGAVKAIVLAAFGVERDPIGLGITSTSCGAFFPGNLTVPSPTM